MANASLDKNAPVAVAGCGSYGADEVREALSRAFDAIGVKESLSGKKVVIKPNFVAKRTPDEAATVHPAVLAAVADVLHERGADDIVLAESPGGVYSQARLRAIYASTGAEDVAEAHGITLNYDCGYREVSSQDGKVCRLYDIIDPILDADVIVDVSKLKTHALTGMSAAVKNMFGAIPGIVKFEMHSRYPDYGDFAEMLVDLCELLCGRAEFVSVTDGIVGMEGNGPTAGKPKHLGALLVSRNPFASDAVAAALIGRDGEIGTVVRSAARGYCSAKADGCRIVELGASVGEMSKSGFELPDSADKNMIEVMRTAFGGRIYKLFAPYPVVDAKRCVGCGVCASSCPRKTIKMTKTKSGKHVPEILRDGCIRCFCCQELCPHGAVKIKKNPITRILS